MRYNKPKIRSYMTPSDVVLPWLLICPMAGSTVIDRLNLGHRTVF